LYEIIRAFQAGKKMYYETIQSHLSYKLFIAYFMKIYIFIYMFCSTFVNLGNVAMM